ncbi:family 78 glycoside hydrolase catalytic domain [Leifsonia sp. NPDC058292]|uniref:family 78 glycoside hydrolase catalytic domain n=1 Tax=Leifsonia sp. NPDC058292 TaxID=3346428 RepID=UPI0036DAA687
MSLASAPAAPDAGPPDAMGRRPLAAPHGLTADGQTPERPAGERVVATVATRTPVLTWKTAPEPGSRGACRYEVEVLNSDGRRLWGSGEVDSTATEAVIGSELSPHSAHEWRVRVADDDGRWSPWATSSLETGPFEYAHWHARWLAVPHLAWVVTPVRLERPIERARLYLTGQGVVRARINGITVNPDRMDPSRTDFTRALFRSYDVTDLLAVGDNTLDVVAGLGEWARTEHSPRLLAEVMVWHDDGSVLRAAPGPDSLIRPSEVEVDAPFYLERHDAIASVVGADRPSPPIVLEAAEAPASAATPPMNVSADPTPPLRTVQTFIPTEIGRPPGARIFDVGVNIAGRASITLLDRVPRGTAIRVQHGEYVGADDHIDTTNLTMPYDHGRERQVVEFVATGEQGEVHDAWFAYFGFRYLEVRGLPDDAAIAVTAFSMHTDLAASGTIATDSSVIDKLLATARRTLLNNVHGVPEDCPTREQAAWTGDTASVAEFELAALESATFFDKWIADLETSQHADGRLPAVAPDLHATRMPSDPVWGSALHRILLGHLLHYGDIRLTRRALPALRRWADFQLSCADEDGIISRAPISYGHDWLALEQTPPAIHHTAAVIDCLSALAALEEVLGDHREAERRRATADELRAAARRAFYDPANGTFGNGSQGSYGVAIEAGVLTGRDAREAGDRLVELIRGRGDRVSSGFATTRSVVRALTMLGEAQVVYDVLSQPEAPGVGAMLASGPGTFWECWWIDPANTGTGSLDHVGLGGPFAAWAWEGLAGVRPTAPGYTAFRVAPQFIDGVTRLELRTETVRGEVVVAYSREASTARLEITVPPGSEATLALRGRTDTTLTAGSHVIEVETPVSAAPTSAMDAVHRSSVSVAPVAADVVGSRTLLDASEVQPGPAAPTLEPLQTLTCMPVPHEQPTHPVLRVVGSVSGPADLAPTVLLTLRDPLPLDGVEFVYALIDQCIEAPERAVTPILVLRLRDGRTMEGSSDGWPAGWNRVAVDTRGLGDGIAVVAVEVGLAWGDAPNDNALAVYASGDGIQPGFHLGEVGYSIRPRTW